MRLSTLSLMIVFYLNTFGQTGPGGVGNVTNNGLWLKASNNNDAIQLVASQQPTYFSTSLLNNQPIIRLDGSNDQMQIADADILDNSAGLTFFAVIRGSNIDGTPRGILGKRRDFNTSTNYSYTWFFHSGRSLFTDIETQNNRFSTAATYSSGTNYILSLRYDGTSPSSSRVRVYTEETLSATGTEASATIGNSNQPLTLGALNKDYSSYLGADYAEVIQYNFAVNTAQRIIINNYLSAQYNISLSSNDLYINDNPSNGNYDYEVAGIGRIDASNIHSDAQGSSAPRFLNPTDLNDGEFMLWGHNNATGNEYSDIPAGIEGRMNRVWRISERNTSGSSVDVGTVDLRWDLSKGTPATAAHLRLLIDTDNDGAFSDETPISGATSLGGNQFEFSGVSLIRDSLRFTLASIDTANTPLPVTWLNFYGEYTGYHNVLKWATLSEINNNFFSIIVNSFRNFSSIIYPNPANGSVTINTEAIETITLLDGLGRTIEVPSIITSNGIELNTSLLKHGLYFIRTVEKISGKTAFTKILIQH